MFQMSAPGTDNMDAINEAQQHLLHILLDLVEI